jgi:hypothetical protein
VTHLHDHLNATLLEMQKRGYDISPPTAAEWLQPDEFAENLNGPGHLKCKPAITALDAETI